MSDNVKKYIGVLHQNLRDTNTLSPKIYLSRIETLEGEMLRDHCWISLSKDIDSIRPYGPKAKALRISFKAKTYEYQAYDKFGNKTHMQIGLKSLRDVKVLGVYRPIKKRKIKRSSSKVKELPWDLITLKN